MRAIPQDYWNVAKVLRLSRFTTFTKIIVPATLPYMFTGYRLSLGIAWLVIVASEMLTGTPGVGGFLWQEYNSLIYAHILLAILTIGLVGFVLDRLMGLAEARLRTRLSRGVHRSPRRLEVVRRRRPARGTCCDDVSLSVERGEFVSIVGAMGSGKSTLLSMLAGPDRARRRHGRRSTASRCAACAATRRSCSRTTRCCRGSRRSRTCGWPSTRRFRSWPQARAARAGDAVRSSSSASATRCTGGRGQLSGGMRQRVAIARAFATEPEMLFLDEPFGALDALTRETLQQELARLCAAAERPVTTVMITNNVEEAILLSDRIVPMTRGPPATLGAPIRGRRWRGRARVAQLRARRAGRARARARRRGADRRALRRRAAAAALARPTAAAADAGHGSPRSEE